MWPVAPDLGGKRFALTFWWRVVLNNFFCVSDIPLINHFSQVSCVRFYKRSFAHKFDPSFLCDERPLGLCLLAAWSCLPWHCYLFCNCFNLFICIVVHMKFSILAILSVWVSGVRYIHNIVQLPLPSTSVLFAAWQCKTFTLNGFFLSPSPSSWLPSFSFLSLV